MREHQTTPPLSLTRKMRAPVSADTARQLEAFLPDMRRVARQLSTDWQRADDLVQEALLALWVEPESMPSEPDLLRDQAFLVLRDKALARQRAPSDLKSDVA